MKRPSLSTCALLLLLLSGCDRIVDPEKSVLEDTKWSVEGEEQGLFFEMVDFECEWVSQTPFDVNRPDRLIVELRPRASSPAMQAYAEALDLGELTGSPVLRITLPPSVPQEHTYVAFPANTSATELPPSILLNDFVNTDGQITVALSGVKMTYERGHGLADGGVTGDLPSTHEFFIHHLRIPEQRVDFGDGRIWTVDGYLSDARTGCVPTSGISVE